MTISRWPIDGWRKTNPECVSPRRRPPKMASSTGVWQASAQRTRRDDFKFAVSDASSMKGLSTIMTIKTGYDQSLISVYAPSK